MGPGGIVVVLAMYWLNGEVGAVSLPPGDQYSPSQSLYRTDVAQGPLSYPNWLKYQQDLTTRLESPDYISGSRRADVNYVSKDLATLQDSVIPDLDILPFVPEEWKVTGSADVRRNSTGSAVEGFRTLEVSEGVFTSNDDDSTEEIFQDQGPGSVEVYKLDLHRESPLLAPHAVEKQSGRGARTKSKIPKKAIAEEILWKLKPIDANKSPLPPIFRQPPLHVKDSTQSQEFTHEVKSSHKDEGFAVGGVPELQVGCEGLEAAKRKKRAGSNIDKMKNAEDWENPVYRESTESILLRVTPIVLDDNEEEPPSGEFYEEMDELMKIKKLQSTIPESTTRRSNRADIDPALEMDKHQQERTEIETFPERGDLGPPSNGNSGGVEKCIDPEPSNRCTSGKGRFRKDTFPIDSSTPFVSDFEDKKDTSGSSSSQIANSNHRSGRKILWVENSGRQGHGKPATSSKHHQVDNEHDENANLWGSGNEDGALLDTEDEPDRAKLREAEIEKRRPQDERRKQEALHRRHRGMKDQPHPQNDNSKGRNVNTEIENIHGEYGRQLENQRSGRQRVSQGRRQRKNKHGEGIDQRRIEQVRPQQEENARGELEEEEERRRDRNKRHEGKRRRSAWNSRREEEKSQKELGIQQNYEDPPSELVKIEFPNDRNMARGQRNNDDEERKLRDYIKRNRPVNPKKARDHQRPDEMMADNDEHQRGQQPSEAKRQQQVTDDRRRKHQPDRMDEHQRRQHELHRNERRRSQLEEQQRQRDNEEIKKPVEEQRRRERPYSRTMEEEKRRRLEQELQDYVRRNQPIVVPKRNSSQTFNTSQASNLEEQRRTIEAARQWDHSRRPSVNRDDGRVHGPSAPANIGQRYPQDDQDDTRQRQGRVEKEPHRESNRRRLEEEESRKEAEYRRVQSRGRDDGRKRLEEVGRADESRKAQSAERTNPWQGYGSPHRPASEALDRDAEELRRREAAERTTDNAMRNRELEWRRRSEERAKQQLEQERERHRLENERNSRNNQRRRPQHEDNRPKTRQRSESVRGGYNEAEWKRHEYARLNSLPVSARIIIRSDGPSRERGRTPSEATPSTLRQPSEPSIGTRGNFDNDVDFRGLNPNRPGLKVPRFPAPATLRPPVASPGACTWAIVQCCLTTNRRMACFESMGCPGVNWDSNPCRSGLTNAAREEIVRFYADSDRGNTRN